MVEVVMGLEERLLGPGPKVKGTAGILQRAYMFISAPFVLVAMLSIHDTYKPTPMTQILQAQVNYSTINIAPQVQEFLAQRPISTSTTWIPDMYIVTPTYARATEKSDLTSIFQALELSGLNIQMILVEDTDNPMPSPMLQNLAKSYKRLSNNVNVTLLVQKTVKSKNRHRGVYQRNLGLDWVAKHQKNESAIVYFGDDDNTYDQRVFQEFSTIGTKSPYHRVGLLPVGLVAGWWEGPRCENGTIVKFHTGYAPSRTVPLDMAGFAFTMKAFVETGARFKDEDPPGMLETRFACRVAGIAKPVPWSRLTAADKSKFVGLANDCKEIYVWHTKTQQRGGRGKASSSELEVRK